VTPDPNVTPAGNATSVPAVTADSAATAAPNVTPDPAQPDSQPPSRASWRAPVGLVALLAVLLLALAGLDGWLLASRPGAGSRSERDQALSSAKTAVPAILSYDYRHFDSDVSTARGRLTGRAVTDYAQAMDRTIKPTATKVHAVVQAQTDGAGVEAVSADGKQVTVVVFGEQKVTNTSLSQPRIDLFRVRVTLDRVGGQWLVSKFDQI
jgi:Mce-associated membrane protein